MQCRLFTVLVMVLFLIGCGGERIGGDYTAKIRRSVSGRSDSQMVIIAENVVLNYNQRTLQLTGVKNIAGESYNDGGWVVNKIEMDAEGMTISIASDANYHVWIGKQYHFLPAIVDSK